MIFEFMIDNNLICYGRQQSDAGFTALPESEIGQFIPQDGQ